MEAREYPEIRTRITFFLPVNNDREHRAASAIIRYLRQQRKRHVVVSGFTHSQFPDTVFTGYWWSDQWIREGIVLFVVDYQFALDSRELQQALRRLKQTIKQRYESYGSKQEEIWVIGERVIHYK